MRSSNVEPYTLVLVNQARRALERLALAAQDRVLHVLETELESRAESAERVESRGHTYLRTPVGAGLSAIYEGLPDEESPVPGTRAYVVYALVPEEAGR
jgi:hypothetical protein